MAIFVVFEIFGVKKKNEEDENCKEYVETWCMDTRWGILKRLGTVHSVNIKKKAAINGKSAKKKPFSKAKCL